MELLEAIERMKSALSDPTWDDIVKKSNKIIKEEYGNHRKRKGML